MSVRNFKPFLPRIKPEKPSEDFPLFPHANGTWAKKIRGKLHYFGRWEDPQAALAKYEAEKDDLHAGRLPRAQEEQGGLTVQGLCMKFLTTKLRLRDAGELSPHTFIDYARLCRFLLENMEHKRLVEDLRPADFEKLKVAMSARWGLVRVANCIDKVRVVFAYAHKNCLIARPLVFGEGFRRPSKRALRALRQSQGPRMFEADELRRILEAAGQPLRAMILLGINCGFGNADCGNLPLAALDLDGGWITYPRSKTAIQRRIPLWPETVQALREWLTVRPKPKSDKRAPLVFLTSVGKGWAEDATQSWISRATATLLASLGINGHRNFYALRHTFQTVADECGDFLAVRRIMGHASNDIADVYREKTSDERLRKVTQHVRQWLFPKPSECPDVLPYRKVP
jgi:integrase